MRAATSVSIAALILASTATASALSLHGAELTVPQQNWTFDRAKSRLVRASGGPTIDVYRAKAIPSLDDEQLVERSLNRLTAATDGHTFVIGERFERNGVRGIDVRGTSKDFDGNRSMFRAVFVKVGARVVCAMARTDADDKPAWRLEAAAILNSLRKRGTAVRPYSPPAPRPMAPGPSTARKLQSVSASIDLPRGWRAHLKTQNGREIQVLEPPARGCSRAVMWNCDMAMLMQFQADTKAASLDKMMRPFAKSVIDEIPVKRGPVKTIEAPRAIKTRSWDAVVGIYSVPIGDEVWGDLDRTVEIIAAITRRGRWHMVLVALYDERARKTYREPILGAIRSLRAREPSRNKALERKLTAKRCWKHYWQLSSGEGGGRVFRYYSKKGTFRVTSSSSFQFDHDYDDNPNTGAQSSAALQGNSDGTWYVVGNRVYHVKKKGKPYDRGISFVRGNLMLGRDKYFPCTKK